MTSPISIKATRPSAPHPAAANGTVALPRRCSMCSCPHVPDGCLSRPPIPAVPLGDRQKRELGKPPGTCHGTRTRVVGCKQVTGSTDTSVRTHKPSSHAWINPQPAPEIPLMGRSWRGGAKAPSPRRVLQHPFVSLLPAPEGREPGRRQRSQISTPAPINAISFFHAYELIDFFFCCCYLSVYVMSELCTTEPFNVQKRALLP